MDIRDLVRAVMLVIGISIAAGQFERLKYFALMEGIKAITLSDYKPTYFPFGKR